MKRYLIAIGIVLAMMLSVAPAAAVEPASSDSLGLPDRSFDRIWWFQSAYQVDQKNDNESGDAAAINYNNTDQSNTQKQLGAGGDAVSGPASSDGSLLRCPTDGRWYPKSGDAYVKQDHQDDKKFERCHVGVSSGKAGGGDVDQGQTADNTNQTRQAASAESSAYQVAPVNLNVPIRILSHGDDEVDQSNDNESGDATAINKNTTDQSNEQTQLGLGGDAVSGPAISGDGSGDCGCKSDGGDASTGDAYGGDVSQSQDTSNTNQTEQNAQAETTAAQVAPLNTNSGLGLLGFGLLGGDVIR